MKRIFGVLMFLILSSSIGYAQNPWTWQVSPANPTEIDTVKIAMSFYSNYNLSFESSHILINTEVIVNVSVFKGILPIIGWFGHTETIGHLAPGSYSCELYIDYYIWYMPGGWIYAGSAFDSGNFVVLPFFGDLNRDGVINITDIIYLIDYLFKGGPAPDPIQTGDANHDGKVTVSDVVYLINYLFKGGPPPAC